MDRDELERAWPAQPPPGDFSERVLERWSAEAKAGATDQAMSGQAMSGQAMSGQAMSGEQTLRERAVRGITARAGRRAKALLFAASLASAAALLSWWFTGGEAAGTATAQERLEVPVGRRALAVLEAGAHIQWAGERLEQDRGDVFYRVEPGARFSVGTPAGEVSVLGTCFRVQIREAETQGTQLPKKPARAAAGAALGATALVMVYEGKVQLSHAGERLELRAGEAGTLGADGPERADALTLVFAERARQLQLAADDKDESSQDNAALQHDIADVTAQLKLLGEEKGALARKLARTEAELTRRGHGGVARERDEFDLDAEDWKELARNSQIKYRVPCLVPNGWTPSQEALDKLGLAPDDAEVIRAAYQRSHARVWGVLRPLCVEAIGNADVVDILGPGTCTHVVLDVAEKADGGAAKAAQRAVAEARAGLRPPPAPGTVNHPVFDLFWTLSGEMPALEADLAESFGPDEAKRLAYAKGMCSGTSTFGRSNPAP